MQLDETGWMCRACHEQEQTDSEFCALCDCSLPDTFRIYFHRDGTEQGPPVPVCVSCQRLCGNLESQAPEWQEHVAEAVLYERDPLPREQVAEPPTMFDLAWHVMTPQERANLVRAATAEADAVFGTDAAEPKG